MINIPECFYWPIVNESGAVFNLKKMKFYKTPYLVATFLFLDALSALAYYIPDARNLIFIILAISAFVITLWRLEAGLILIFSELFIGGKGYLFFYGEQSDGISIRMALFIIVMSVFLAKLLTNFLEHRADIINLKKIYTQPIIKYLYLFLTVHILAYAGAMDNYLIMYDKLFVPLYPYGLYMIVPYVVLGSIAFLKLQAVKEHSTRS